MAGSKHSEISTYILSSKSARKTEGSFPDPRGHGHSSIKYPIYTFEIPKRIFKSGSTSLPLKITFLGFHFDCPGQAGLFTSRDMYLCIKGATSNVTVSCNPGATFWFGVDLPQQIATVVDHKGFLSVEVRKINAHSDFSYINSAIDLLLEIEEIPGAIKPKNMLYFVSAKDAIQTTTKYSVPISVEKFEPPGTEMQISLLDTTICSEPTLCCVEGARDTIHLSKDSGTFLIGTYTMVMGRKSGIRALPAGRQLPNSVQYSYLRANTKILTFWFKEINEGKLLQQGDDFMIVFEIGGSNLEPAHRESQIKATESSEGVPYLRAEEKKDNPLSVGTSNAFEHQLVVAMLESIQAQEAAHYKVLLEAINKLRQEREPGGKP